jgi:hypothetical protein
VVRALRIQGKPGDVVVKLRPIVAGGIPAGGRSSRISGVSVDALPAGVVRSGSLKAELGDTEVK